MGKRRVQLGALLCAVASAHVTAADRPVPTTAPVKAPAFEEEADPFTAPLPATKADGPASVAAPSAQDAPELLLFNDLPVIVAAGKRQQTQREAAASVSVVTDDEIDLFGYRSLAEVLRNQRG